MNLEFFRVVMIGIDFVAASLIFGANIWFFIFQSPLLFTTVVREQFIPIQIRLARLLFSVASIAVVFMAVGTIVGSRSFDSMPSIVAYFLLSIGLLARFIVLPTAIRAGARSYQHDGNHGKTGTSPQFVSQGAGQSATRMHRVVVVSALLMTGGVVANVIVLARILQG